MYKALQEYISFRTLKFLLASLILITLLLSYLYVIKKPFQFLRQQQQSLALLENEMQTARPLKNQIKTQQQLVDQLKLELDGSEPKLPVNKMAAYVIGELDSIAKRYQVNLASIKPQAPEILFDFQELPFQVEISGDYFSLYSWLKDVENNLSSIVVQQFILSPASLDKQRRMFLTIANYQFEDNK